MEYNFNTMKYQIFKSTVLVLFFLMGCKFDKSVSKDFNTSISTEGNGLSVDEVIVSTDAERLDDNVFIYGQKLTTDFENMQGFTVENGLYYAKMGFEITNADGEVIMKEDNLLDTAMGQDASLKTLSGELILAQPMHSGQKYMVKYHITDEKGGGTFSSKMDFEILPNPAIQVQESGLKALEVYVFNKDTQRVITNAETNFDNIMQFQFDNLEGYTVVDGFVAIDLSIKVADAKGEQILYNKNAFENMPLTEADLEEGIGGVLVFSEGIINNPVTWEVEMWDMNSEARLKGVTQLNVN